MSDYFLVVPPIKRWTLSMAMTTGSRFGRLVRMELLGDSNRIHNTSLYRKSEAQRAWFSLKWHRDSVGWDGNVSFDSQVAEEFLNLSFPHYLWMLYVKENDGTLDPLDIVLLCYVGIILQPNGLSNSIQEFYLGLWCHYVFPIPS